jgi:predicted acyl esterase
MRPIRSMLSLTALAVALSAACVHAQTAPMTPDIPAGFKAPTDSYDYIKRDLMIPMRDGVKLHTVIVIPKGAHNAPILLTRTPYNASMRAQRTLSTHMLDICRRVTRCS